MYCVSYIDTKVILSTDSDGTITLFDDEKGELYVAISSHSLLLRKKCIGPFRVISQTTEALVTEGSVIPLFCVATGHNLKYTYKWSTLDQPLSGNTPVMWVNSPGVYRCQVSNKKESCYSANIIVTKENGTCK